MVSDSYAPTKDLGDGVTTTFTFDWYVISSTDLKISFEVVATGIQTEQTTGFTVTLNDGNVGGTVEFDSAPGDATPADSSYVIIERETEDTQETALTTSSGFQATVVEAMVDKRTLKSQESKEKLDRALTYPVGTSGVSQTLPVPVAGKALKGNSGGTGYELSDVDIEDIDSAVEDAKAQAVIATAQAGIATTKAGEADNSATFAAADAVRAEAAADKITVSETAPSNPSEGDVWIDIS